MASSLETGVGGAHAGLAAAGAPGTGKHRAFPTTSRAAPPAAAGQAPRTLILATAPEARNLRRTMPEHPRTPVPTAGRDPAAVPGPVRTALAVIGTDTGVGKTRVLTLLVHGLRALGERVWIHKPVACGGFDGSTCEDGRH